MQDGFLKHICEELKTVGLSKRDLDTLLLVVENRLFCDFLLCVSNKDIDTDKLMNIELKYKTALCYDRGYKASDLILIKNDTISMYEKENLQKNNQIIINFYNE